METKHQTFMKYAIKEALKAKDKLEVPVGAIIVYKDEIIGKGHNLRETLHLSKAHAEMLAIEQANKHLNSWKLDDCTMYVTLEPCPMCAGAIIQSRIKHVYYGATDYKNGVIASGVNLFNGDYSHKVTVTGGILKEEISTMMKSFFKTLRN